MTLLTTRLVSELQYWFYSSLLNSEINKDIIPTPVEIPLLYLTSNSFIELLFNESFTGNSYKHLLYSNTSKGSWPYIILQRLMIYPASSLYYTFEKEEFNLFNLSDNELTMLDGLLIYKNDNNSLILNDSTSIIDVELISDSTSSWTLNVNYDNVSNLCKLIFVYLDFKINNNFIRFNTSEIISDSNNVLENMYESHVNNLIFTYISNRGS